MAIDDIEYNELVSSSRIGKQNNFVDDDDRYAYANKAKRNRARRIKETEDKYAIPPDKKSDCEYLQTRLIEANNELDAFRKTYKGRVEQAHIDALEFVIAMYKTNIAKAKCVETAVEQEKEKEKQQTMSVLDKIASTPPPSTPEGEEKDKNITKYVIYGAGGLVLIFAVILLIKRRNAGN